MLTILRYALVIGVFSGVQFFAWEDQERARESESVSRIRGSTYPPEAFRHLRYTMWGCILALVGSEVLLLIGRPVLIGLIAGMTSLLAYVVTNRALHLRMVDMRRMTRPHAAHRKADPNE